MEVVWGDAEAGGSEGVPRESLECQPSESAAGLVLHEKACNNSAKQRQLKVLDLLVLS